MKHNYRIMNHGKNKARMLIILITRPSVEGDSNILPINTFAFIYAIDYSRF